jgi:hypothetical protein
VSKNMLSIVGLGALFMAASVVACSNDDDNPGNSAGSAGKAAGGSSGKGGSGNAGKPNTGDAGSGEGPSGAGAAGQAPSEGGAAGQTNEPAACDIYAERPNGVKEIPHDGEGNITTDHLTSDTVWSLAGRWFVKPDHTLTIDPCTLIEGSSKPNAGSLFVPQGAKLHAVGSKDAPIVFTTVTHEFISGAPWGGVVLIGKATVARANETPTYTRAYEGYTDPRTQFGLANPADFDDNDSSGEMQYVRIEFGGDLIVADKEINGLSFAGVGAGTTIDHIQVKDQQDDCFEFFGGTVNANHLICQNAGDDMFDADLGFRGHLQYIFGRNLVEGTSSDPNGFEWDGNQDDLAAPEDELAQPHVSNATLCGLNMTGTAVGFGGLIRRNVAPGTSLLNVIITGFDNGIDLRNHVGTNADPFVAWTNSLFFDQLKANGQSATDDDSVPATENTGSLKGDYGFVEDTYLNDAANANVLGGDAPAGFDCYSEVPKAPSAAVAGGTPEAPFKTNAKFIGAGDFNGDGWNAGSWIEWK